MLLQKKIIKQLPDQPRSTWSRRNVLIPPWCLHSYGYRSCDIGLLHLWILFHQECLGISFQVNSGNRSRCPELSFTVSKEWHALFMERWQLWKQFGKKGKENEFFQNILNLFLEEGLFYKKLQDPSGRNIVSETIALIRNSNGRGCSLDFLAKQARCSKYHLVHRVRQETGRTIGSFIEEARHIYVRSAEKQGLSQKEIAWNLGFSSAVSFWNWYHKRRTK